jgi:hypothetical protein
MSNNHHALGTDKRPNKRMSNGRLFIVKRICKFCNHDKGIDTLHGLRKCARCKKEVQ